MTSPRLAGALLAAGCTMLVLCSLGTAAASAGTCPEPTGSATFELGITNTCNHPTLLESSANTPFTVSSSLPSATVLTGSANALTGQGWGVEGVTSSSGINTYGVLGNLATSTPGNPSAGVYGVSNGTTAFGPGVWGSHDKSTGAAPGVYGSTASTSANSAGVSGQINSNAANAAGVRGENFSATCCGMGVAGFHYGQGIGIYGESLNGFAVSGFSPNNWSGYFQGSVRVVGTLTKTAGAFRIDHPLDPAHSYLQHSFVESPEMMNIYKGHALTDGKGFATVTLPAWFQALNREFEYQLTVVGKAHWDARAAIWQEIAHNRFTIRTDQPNVKVSWQVTGVRHDPYANAHRIQVVVPKEGQADGRYVHPELYGKPLSKSVVVLPGMTPHTQPKFQAAPALKQR